MSALRPDHISVTNVRPAYEASLARGVTHADLEALGLPRAVLDDDEGSVTGAATYAHMEWMDRQGDMTGFVLDATGRHSISSLGIVGLRCKTLPTVGEAFACHARFQHLTNRTARYTHVADGRCVRLVEERWGPPRRGSVLISDYAMLIAVRLLRLVAGAAVPVVALHSRRVELDPAERSQLEAFVGAPVVTGADRATLVLGGEVVATPVATADPELAAYFRDVLARAARFGPDEPEVVSRARVAIQDAFTTGTPTGVEIGRRLGMSQRTLQRRLQAEGVVFQELIADTRMRLAEGYLVDAELTLSEVAWLVGYREVTSFFRAFKRSKGITPAAWRAEAMRSQGV